MFAAKRRCRAIVVRVRAYCGLFPESTEPVCRRVQWTLVQCITLTTPSVSVWLLFSFWLGDFDLLVQRIIPWNGPMFPCFISWNEPLFPWSIAAQRWLYLCNICWLIWSSVQILVKPIFNGQFDRFIWPLGSGTLAPWPNHRKALI